MVNVFGISARPCDENGVYLADSEALPSSGPSSANDWAPYKDHLQFEAADFLYTEELKQYTLATLPKLGVPWEYIYFPGVAHGFAARGNPNEPKQKEALERAKDSAVNFFKTYLH